jgi:hypothetical protein
LKYNKIIIKEKIYASISKDYNINNTYNGKTYAYNGKEKASIKKIHIF